jgi:dynein heavy chain
MALLYLILEEKIKIQEAYKSKVQEAGSQITSLRKKIEEANAAYDQNLTKSKRKLEKLIPEMEERLKELVNRIGNSKIGEKAADINKTVDFLTDISNEIFELYDQSKKINLFQKSLQLEETNYEKINNFKLEFVMIQKLWCSRKEFRDKCATWGATHFLKVPIDQMTDSIDRLKKIANECNKELETNEVSRIFKQEIEDFQVNNFFVFVFNSQII